MTGPVADLRPGNAGFRFRVQALIDLLAALQALAALQRRELGADEVLVNLGELPPVAPEVDDHHRDL